MKKRLYWTLTLILVFLIISGINGCDISGFNKEGKSTPSKDLMEFDQRIGGLTAKLIVKPGKDRISVNSPVNVAIEIINNGDEDISGEYILTDTPGDMFGGIPGAFTGSFFAEAQDTKDTIKDTTQTQYNGISQTQFILDLTWDDQTFLSVDDICVKEDVNMDVGVKCDPESSESVQSSKSPIISSKAEKRLVDSDFDGKTDELTLSFKLNIDKNCKLRLDDPIQIESLSAAGITGFDCTYEGNTLFCNTPVSIIDFYTGPLEAILNYECNTKLNTGAIKLNPKEAQT